MTDLTWMRPKLAELCGLVNEDGCYRDDRSCYSAEQEGPLDPVWWAPDLDVEQSVRCLAHASGESKRFRITVENDVARVAIGTRNSTKTVGGSLPRAICLAIAAALGWEEPG